MEKKTEISHCFWYLGRFLDRLWPKTFTVYRQNGQSVKIHLARLISYLVSSMYLHPASGFYSQSVSASVNFTFKTASRSINAGIKLSRINRSISSTLIFVIYMNRCISFFQHKQPYCRVIYKSQSVSQL